MQRILTIGAGLVATVFLAWVIVSNVLQARNRSRQKQTMADMRSIATAWEARATKVNSYSVGTGHMLPAEQRVTAAELARALQPTYIRKLPSADGWGTAFQFATAGAGTGGQEQSYVIRSFGSDGRPDRMANLNGPTTNFSDDIIFADGSFFRYPEGAG